MENCVDHHDELGVFTCSECERLICDKHENMLCARDKSSNNTAIVLLVFIVVSFGIFSLIIYNFIFQLGEFATEVSSIQEGDVITVNGEVTTVTDVVDLPSTGTIIAFLFLAIIPILVTITFFLRRLMLNAEEPLISLRRSSSDSELEDRRNKTYFCQQCGTKLTWQDDTCTSCGKSTDEEKRLVK